MHRKALRRTVAVIGGAVVALSMTVPVSATKISDPDVSELIKALQTTEQNAKVSGITKDTPRRITAFVEVNTPPVVDATKSGKSVKQAKAEVQSKADAVASAIADPNATVLYTTENAVSGFAVEGDAEAITKLAERDDVVSVVRMTEHTIENATSVSLTRAVNAWQAVGNTGKDVNIAVIDSGVDFTHKTFGGTGDYSPYTSVSSRQADVTWPQGKVIGGWDYVGDNYTGAGQAEPDGNPIDVPAEYCYAPAEIDRSGGHGSHVAGTAAGFGVDASGETFSGDYASLTDQDLQQMKVGPGTAPEANILAMKVFGCAGSTAYIMDALDDLLSKNDDGSYKWDVDVVNMSLGATYAPAADPENVVVNRLFEERGIISVIASGNSGDFWVIGGSPGNAASSLTVANSINGVHYYDVAQMTGHDDGVVGQYSVNYQWEDPEVGPMEIVKLNATGCDPLTADQAAMVAGKAVFLDWNSDNLTCGSNQRFNNVEDAGGTGVVLEHQYNSFDGGIAGNEGIPGFQLLADGTQALNAALNQGTVEITYQKAGIYAHREEDASAVDTLNWSSSRGLHGSFGIVKPDVTAPGTNIMSAAVGSGNEATSMTGTSMATPHTAGIVALTKAENPNWSAYQLKANVMNTAFHDITNGSTVYGPVRTGSGRVDALAAVQNKVIMYDSQAADLASVNFGVVEFPQSGYSADRKVTVENLGSAAANLSLAYKPATSVPGVSFSVTPSSVSVPAGGKVEVSVAVNIDAAAYQKTLDPTMQLKHSFGGPELIREYVSNASGRLVATGVGAPEGGELHLPVNVAPKPASDLHGAVDLDADGAGGTISIAGETFGYKAAYEASGELSHVPLAMAFQHVADSGERPVETELDEMVAEALKSTDLKTVGVATTLENLKAANAENPDTAKPLNEAKVLVGVETYGAWSALPIASQSVNLEVKVNDATYWVVGIRPRGTDTPVYAVFDEEDNNTGIFFPNDVPGALIDSNRLDTAVVAIPFNLESVGVSEADVQAGNVDLEITVLGQSWYAMPKPELELAAEQTDRVNFTFNPTKAKFSFDNALGATNGVHLDGESLPFTYDEAAAGGVVTEAKADDKVMLIHFHNKVGSQVELLPLVAEPTPEPTEEPTEEPTAEPTEEPTEEPTAEPTEEPTEEPTAEPTEEPTAEPTEEPTVAPTEEPTVAPTEEPGPDPTVEPTPAPSDDPTAAPSPSETGEPGKPLPPTGSNVLLPALLAAGLLGAGGVLVSRKYAK